MAQNRIVRGSLEYIASDNIAVPHAFTTRRGGNSSGVFSSLNIAMHRGDASENVERNIAAIAEAVGFDPSVAVLTRQIHSDRVRRVSRDDARGLDHKAYPECDALISCDCGTALIVFTADCTPILLWDPISGAVGAVHAGWRGTAADIAGGAVRAMTEEFGCRAENIRAAIGPNIGVCCFETDADVPDALRATYGREAERYIFSDGKKYRVDLKGVNSYALRRMGVVCIDVSDECTACAPDRFWSHRLSGAARGSQGAVIVCGKA